MANTKISACIVVHNEEELIKRCLDSIRDVADEIIIVHDGPCKDKTLDICRKYTKKIFVRQHVGEAEPHRPFSLEKAASEWILVLDADEYLSKELQKGIKGLIKNKDADGYRFIWTVYYNGKKVTKGPLSRLYRLVLFRKNKTSISGLIHDWFKVSGNIKNVNLVVEHKPVVCPYTYERFKKKDLKWARIQAERQIKGYKANHAPVFYIFKAALWFVFCFFHHFFIKLYFVNGLVGLKISLLESLYNFYVNWYIFKLKLKSFAGRKAKPIKSIPHS